ARENNVANALAGKIAGVDAAGISTGPGGSSRVVIRGNGSVTGNSQPLYVINGMPMDNSVPGGSSLPYGQGLTQSVDRGDGIAAINPDDIESITVLKGGTAAALYGSRGANGVILITTKKGKAQKGVGIEYNSIFSFEKISVFPDYQYEYGQGDGGLKPTTLAAAQASGRRSFGSRIDGSTDYVAADGLKHPYVAQRDNLKNFYQTGNTFTNTLAFSGGNESILYRLSLSNLKAQSILPNSTYDRKTANLNISAKLSDKLRVESVMQFNLETGNNRPAAGDALGNPNWTPYGVANTVDIRWLSPGYDPEGNELLWNDVDIATNSYFVINKFKENDSKNRFIGQASVAYDILKNLTLKGTVTRDFYNYNFTSIMPTGTRYRFIGEYAGIKSDVAETNGMFTVTYKTRLTDKFGISALGGANSRKFENKEINLIGQGFIQRYFYSFTNLATYSIVPNTTRTVTNSVFGSIDFDYKNFIFFTATGRQDWFSTLSPSNNHIFYPSFGTSFVLSDAFSLPRAISVARIRASWAQVGGGGPDPYAINHSYRGVPSASSVPLQNVTSAAVTNSELRPFTSTTAEVGLNVQLLDNRLGLDLALYDRKTTDDIVNVPISSASGYNSAILNSGQLSNKGIEALLTGTPIKTANFSWDVSYNFAYNRSLVLKLADGISTVSLGSGGNAYIKNNVNQTYGAIYGYRKLRDANGNIVFDTKSGLPMQTDINQELGKGVPPVITGLTNEFRYKNFSLSVMIDGKFGNNIFSVTEAYATRLGLLKSTLAGRENGLTLTGVTPAGDSYTHTIPVSNLRAGYYNSLNRYTELFIHDAGFVKLRQMIFTFRLPLEKLKFLKLQHASISLTGRNLLILYKNTVNFDPEQAITNGPAQGIESFGLPRTRSYGVHLMLKF
ncbi:MAG: SusC/RagA family protein, partial [Candidatus Nephrothrix sp. EaCA]